MATLKRSTTSLLLRIPLLAGLLGAPGTLQAQWPVVVNQLPGVDVLGVAWGPGGAWLLGGSELRRLSPGEGSGDLLLRECQQLTGPATELVIGERLAALHLENGGLLVDDLQTGEQSMPLAGISTLAQGGQTLLAAGEGGLWLARLDLSISIHNQSLGAFSAPPTALCGHEGLAWLVAADTLRGFGLGDPPLPLGRLALSGVRRLAEHEDRLLACRGDEGLTVVDLADPFVPVAWPWQPDFPVLDALWWRDQLFVLAAGDSGLVLLDTADPHSPRLLGRWNTVRRAERLALHGDSLLVAEGAEGLSLHLLRAGTGSPHPELLARHASRPQVLEIQNGQLSRTSVWLLDRKQGFRVFEWPEPVGWPPSAEPPHETAGVVLPLPVDGGDWRDGLIAGCRYGAGLRFFQETESGIQLRGIHPTDPVQLLAWGPEDLIAYVTPEAFVALKQANRTPWYLLHHGWVNLQGLPLCAAWTGDRRLFVGCADGRLCQVDARDPLAPVLEQVYQLGGPVRDLSVIRSFDSWSDEGLVVVADALHRLDPRDGAWALRDSLQVDAGRFTCVAINEVFGLAGLADPPRLLEFTHSSLGLTWIDELGPILPAAPSAVGRRLSDDSLVGLGWAALENGDLLELALIDHVGIEPGARRPSGLDLRAAPNPFNPSTRLSFSLSGAVAEARLLVHDLGGREIWRRELGAQAAGTREFNVAPSGWASGLYIATLEADGQRACCKLLLAR